MPSLLHLAALALIFLVPGTEAQSRPVTKVITLLQDMLKQLEKEAQEDQDVYDKLACWCETNDKDKTKAITDAEARISDLTTTVEGLTATSARLSTEIKGLEQEVAKNKESLDQATALRQKQLAEFNGEEKDMLESVSALKAAITVLSKHHPGALLQGSSGGLAGVAKTLGYQLKKHASLLAGVLTPTERRAIQAFVQAPEDYLGAAPTFRQSYTPQSSQIFGILKQMLETFTSNLSEAQKEELSNQQAYEGLKAAKEAEIAAGQAQLDTKSQELATSDEKLAQAKQDIEDTRNSLSADEQFLMMLKEKCQLTDKEWEERQKTRSDEIGAIHEALTVLSSDDAHDLFTRTFNPSLLQLSSKGHSDRRTRASAVLSAAARRLGSPALAALATSAQLDAFERVKKAIDDMVAQLLKQKEDEIKHRDFCVDELNTNQLQTERKEREKQDLEAKVTDLKGTIQALQQATDALKADIAEMQKQLKRAGEDREMQNKDFQATVADQRETQKLLQQAVTVLKAFYEKNQAAAASLLAEKKQAPAGPPPPAGFKEYQKSAASGGVVGLLQQIIADAKAMEADAIRAEEDAQKAYEAFVQDTNGAVEAKNRDVVNKAQAKAQAEADLAKATQGNEAAVLELSQLSNYNAQLHQSCDFVTKNFEIRQTARDEEVEALRQAKAILSGADFDTLA